VSDLLSINSLAADPFRVMAATEDTNHGHDIFAGLGLDGERQLGVRRDLRCVEHAAEGILAADPVAASGD
jgi:hypothetical protein